MIDKEKLHQILSSLWKNDDSVGKMCYNQALQDVQIAIDTMQEEPVDYDKLNTMLNDALSKETKESWNERLDKKCMYALPDFTNGERVNLCEGCEELCKYNPQTAAKSLGISSEEYDKIVDECLYGKEPELVDFDDMPLDPNIQYESREIGIKIQAEDYSFNIESELFQQLNKEQQELWRKELEQAFMSGGYCGLNLGLDKRYDKEEPVSGLDNGDMPKERWKQAVEAASHQRSYRSSKGLTETRDDYFVDGVQWADEHPKEEPVSNSDWLTELQEKLDNATPEQLEELWNKYNGVDEKGPVSEELEEAAKNHAVERYRVTRDMVLAEKCKWSFKAGAEWQKTKDESTTEDLGEYINELSKQFPEVSFAKLSRIAVRVAKWQKAQFEKNRLKHCNSITNEQAELEQGFIDQHLDKHQRMPTFLDAIEYGMRLQKEQMMAKAVDATLLNGNLIKQKHTTHPLYVGDEVKLIVIKED